MEDSPEIDVTAKNLKKPRLESEIGSDSLKDKTDSELEKVIPNGTGNSSIQDISEEPNVTTIKITKISKSSKVEALKDSARIGSLRKKILPENPTKLPSPSCSPSSSSLSEDFCGFPESTDLKEQIRKKEAFNRIISSLEDVRDNDGESKEGEAEGKTMTVEDADGADSDSNQMEIDESNSRADSAEFSEKNEKGRTRDSDVDVVEIDSVKSVESPTGKTEDEGTKTVGEKPVPMTEPQPKVEYCGICSEVVDDMEEGICCDGKCERWLHLSCSGLTQAEYDELSGDENAKWACNRCSGKPPPEIKPGAKPLLTVRKDLTAPAPVITPVIKRKVGSREGKSPRVDISNPAFLKPFDYGWKRELVYRSTNDSQNKRQGDVYYYTPKGKKLRSLREISEHVIGTDLTLDNFTFWKDALGCDSEKEIIRDAKIKLVNKDLTASPGVPKKVVTPKTPKTPKAAPKLTATVTPLDSTSGLPVAKASASVTPRVVLKTGKTGSLSTGPKFKVTPSKTSVPGQTQKIVISKGAEKATSEIALSTKDDISKNVRVLRNGEMCSARRESLVSKDHLKNNVEIENEGEEIDIMPKNKFRRYGLLANRISTRNIARNKRPKGSSSSSSCSSEDLTSADKEIRRSLLCKLNNAKVAGVKTKGNFKPQSQNKTVTPDFPSISTSLLNHTSNSPLTPDKIILPDPNVKRPRSPEIQFRPSDPSSYGCQTSAPPPCRPVGPNISGISSSFHHPFETVLIVDTSSTESLVNTPKRRTAPCKSPSPVQWTHDCSIEVISVETLPKDGFSNENYLAPSPSRQTGLPLRKQPALIRAVEGDRNGHLPFTKNSNESSPVSIASSSTDIVIIDEDAGDNSSPPFLMRNSPPPKLVRNASPSRSPPNLQANLPPPPLLSFPSPPTYSSRTIIEQSSNTAAGKKSVRTRDDGGSSTTSLSSSEDTQVTDETGSKYEEYRKFKRQRFYERQSAKQEMEKLKRSYQKERTLFIKRKSEEKKLQIDYLRLKVKIKAMKIALMKKKVIQE